MSINNDNNTSTSKEEETVQNHSPRQRDTGTGGNKSPQSLRNDKGMVAPWAQIVRGGESQLMATAPSSSAGVTAESQGMAANAGSVEEILEDGSGPNGNAGKRPAWNKPSNGEFVPVMGADSWPPLRDSARASSKSSSDSLKGLDESSSSLPIPAPQVAGTAANLATTPHARQKRNGGNSNGPSNGPSRRSGFAHSGNYQPHISFRNRNGNHNLHGDGSHDRNGGRRYQDGGSYNNRDFRLQRDMQRPIYVSSHVTFNPSPYIRQPHMRPPLTDPMALPGFGHALYFCHPQELLRGMPLVAPMQQVFFPPAGSDIYSKIMKQIDYYFSVDNLAKDIYLRRNMDDQGWVSIELIAGFRKVAEMTNNIQLILDALRSSTVVEVQGNKVRRFNDWERWIMPRVQVPSAPSPQSTLTVGVESISLEDKTTKEVDNRPEAFLSRSSSHDTVSQS